MTKTIDEVRHDEQEGMAVESSKRTILARVPRTGEKARISRLHRCFIDRRNGGGRGMVAVHTETESETRRAHNVPRQLPGKLCNAAIYLGQIDNL